MATLERIRNKSGLLIIVIAIGLLAFLLGDLMSSGDSIFRRRNMQIAEINGTSVSYPEYQNYVTELEDYYKLNSRSSALDENTSYQIREQAWNQMVQDIIMNEKYDDLGIAVTSDEIFEMATGKNVHPQIRQMFTNPQTGVFDRAQVINFLQQKNLDPNANFYWLFLEKQIKKERLFAKYRELIKKGMYVTTAQAKAEAEAKANKVDFDFVVKRYSAVPDSAVTVSESDVKNYYNAHKENYKQEATREVAYISFDVVPSDEDRQMAKEWIENSKVEFANPQTDAIQYVNMNSESNYIPRNLKFEQLSSTLQGFVQGASENEVYGPYLENETYKLSRIVAIKQMPDSVKARHILVNDPALADSLFALVKGGANFAEIARANSADQGSAINGGDLGWFAEGTMVQPFNDACFENPKGAIVKVESQFGIHIINVQDKGKPVTKYNIATLERNITYSSKTNQQVYAQAAKFASMNNTFEKFDEAITADNLVKRYGRSIKANDRTVNNMQHSREMVRWAFEAGMNEMSPIFEFGDSYIIAFVTGAKEEGYQSVAAVKSSIERRLRNDKKAEVLITELNNKKQGNDIAALASAIDSEVMTASQIDFGAFQVPGAGVEPALVALATSSKVGEVSTPVAGNNGVYAVKVNNVTNNTVTVEDEKAQLSQSVGFKVDYQATEAIRSKAEITDERSKFF
ncbi:SurA N-terminal domain-containing protein [Carboxylicivirga mesophila]|uniref:Periplasmic chaperone PpiD n=1 Tax=Carboxylicivirga mesophila TaxID=1166478 RepID=A0ABS5KEV7_9BACT|nr:SurA N-terminal domain-containing protein [Carboxylicivirga mesophila]MBS2213417.1 SurA N-terminal domain-containing protein [Carboxylicivirga mesophila]